jgi:hypothetical protein
MARSWSGFIPQNQSVMEQWSMLEASQSEIESILKLAPPVPITAEDVPEPTEEEQMTELANFFRAHRQR